MNAQLKSAEELCSDAEVAARTGRPLSGTVELCAAPEPISGAAISRPVYNNENVAFADYWIRDNEEALLAWWNAGEHFEGEFLSFCLSQWDYAESHRHELANTLRQA